MTVSRTPRKGDEASERIKDCLDRFQRNFERMVDPAASEEDRRMSVLNTIHFFSYVTLLEEIRRIDPERADQLNRWIGDMLEDGGCGEVVHEWREELASDREITLPAPPAQQPQEAPVPPSPVPVDTGTPKQDDSGQLGTQLAEAIWLSVGDPPSRARCQAIAASLAAAGWRPQLPKAEVATLLIEDGGGVGSVSETIALALADAYAGVEFEDPTFEQGTIAVVEALRERASLPADETERLNQQIATIKAHYQRRCDSLARVRDRYRDALREIQGQHEPDPDDPTHCMRCDDCVGDPLPHPCETHRAASAALGPWEVAEVARAEREAKK